MKIKILLLINSLLFCSFIHAEMIRFRIGDVKGKITSELITLTDWQAAMICHFSLSGKDQESSVYPNTFVKTIDKNTSSIEIKGKTLFEALPGMEINNCALKLILIGKNKTNFQTTFGEILLLGNDHGKMTDRELENLFNKDLMTKTLSDKLSNLTITYGPDGGIISNE
jgi:hypothetical protein